MKNTQKTLPVLLACPFCGHQPEPGNLIDSLYPDGIYRHYSKEHDIDHYTHSPIGAVAEIWGMRCNTSEGGCGAQVTGEGKQGAVDAWNMRKEPK
jgi:hypothetical protein